jgi:serine/threonine-protein kinase
LSQRGDNIAVQEGVVLNDKYLIGTKLGDGGMGVVFCGHHIELDDRVAIKVLVAGQEDPGQASKRFVRAARAAAKIKSEYVARITDIGSLSDGTPYMVMEHLEGDDLAEVMRQQGRIALQTAVRIVLQASVGIAEAHGLGIVHRDLKPANLFCVRGSDGRQLIKVLDFGVSKFPETEGTTEARLTKTSQVVGTLLYASPEQLKASRDVDVRTDIWALGVILFELLTGTTPFEGSSDFELAAAIMSHPPKAIRQLCSDVPEGLEVVLEKCFEKDRERRYRNVADFVSALKPYATPEASALVERICRIQENELAQFKNSGPSTAATPIVIDAGAQPDASTVSERGDEPLLDDNMPLTIMGSSAGGGYQAHPAYSHDNNLATRFTNDGRLTSASITYELSVVAGVSKIRLLMYQGRTRTYPIKISVGSTVVFSGSTTTETGYWEIAFPTIVDCVVTVTMTGPNSSGNTWFSIVEAQILGSTTALHLDVGRVSPYFTSAVSANECALQEPLILVSAGAIRSMADLLPTMELAAKGRRPLFLVTSRLGEEPLATLILNHQNGNLPACAIRIDPTHSGMQSMRNIAKFSAAQVFGDEARRSLSGITASDLGRVQRIVCTDHSTVLRKDSA